MVFWSLGIELVTSDSDSMVLKRLLSVCNGDVSFSKKWLDREHTRSPGCMKQGLFQQLEAEESLVVL